MAYAQGLETGPAPCSAEFIYLRIYMYSVEAKWREEITGHRERCRRISHDATTVIDDSDGLVVEYWTRNFQVAGSDLTAGHLQATLSKLLIYCVLIYYVLS